MKHVRTQIRRAWSGGMLGVLQDAVEVYNKVVTGLNEEGVSYLYFFVPDSR